MIRRRYWVGLLSLAIASCFAAPASAQEVVVTDGPPPVLRAHMDAFIKAFNSGSAEQWEAMAKTVFTPAFFKRQTPDERKKAFLAMRADLGTITVQRVERQGGPDAPLQIIVKGSVKSGVLWIDLDDDHRFDSLKAEIDKQP